VCYHDASEVKTGRTQLAHGHMARCGLWTFYRWYTLEPDIQIWWNWGSSCLNVAQTTVPLKYCDFYVKNISINNLANVIQLRLPGGTITYTTSAFEKVNVNSYFISVIYFDILRYLFALLTVMRSSFDNDERHLTAFRSISEASHSWSCDKPYSSRCVLSTFWLQAAAGSKTWFSTASKNCYQHLIFGSVFTFGILSAIAGAMTVLLKWRFDCCLKVFII